MRSIKTFYNNTHIINCDLLNKYNCNTYHLIPNVSKLEVKILLDDFKSLYSGKANEESPNEEFIFQTIMCKVYIITYLLFSNIPYLTIKKLKSNFQAKKKIKKDETLYYIKLLFSNSKFIFNILMSLFFENIQDEKNIIKKEIEYSYRELKLKLGFPLQGLTDFHFLLGCCFKSIYLQEDDIYINFLATINVKSDSIKMSNNLASNMSFFWQI